MTVKEFFETNRGNLCIHCDTERKANKLLKKFHELGKCWCSGKSYLDYNRYGEYGENTVYCNDNSYTSLSWARITAKVIIEFDELDDFKFENMFKNVNCLTKIPKFELNHEKDVFDYLFLGEMFFQIPKSPKDMLIVNKEKKYVLLKLNSKEYRVDCHKEDKFDWLIGFGLALSQCYGNREKWKNAREYFRNPKTHKLNYKEYAKWCVYDFFSNDTTKISKLQDKVKEINELGKVDL